MMNYSIGTFAKLTNTGIHTLRYYEQERLLMPKRDPHNRRLYSEQDLSWIEFIKRLKDTGMPIKEIRRYAQLRAQGNTTLCERLALLQQHRTTLAQTISRLKEHLTKLDDKITYYQAEIKIKH